MGKDTSGYKLIANNKKARHDYFLEETFEAGVALHGTEVKSLRRGNCSIKEAFIHIENGEVIIYGMHISPYEKGNIFNKDPMRPKKLLMHKKEILRLLGKIKESSTLPVVTKVSTASRILPPDAAALLEQNIRISELYEAVRCEKYHTEFIHEFSRQLIIL